VQNICFVRLCDSILFLYTKPHNFQFQHIFTNNVLLKYASALVSILVEEYLEKSKSGRWGGGGGMGDIVCLVTAMVQAMKCELFHFFLCIPLTWEDDHLWRREVV